MSRIMNLLAKGAMTHAGMFHADDVFATALLQIASRKEFAPQRVCQVPDDFAGLVYDIGGGEYDHHCNAQVYYDDGTPMASIGRIARELVPEIWGDDVYQILLPFIKDLDEHDSTGILSRTGEQNPVSMLIAGFIPAWDSNEALEFAFLDAVAFAKQILEGKIRSACAKVRAKEYIREQGDVKKGLLILDRPGIPWQGLAPEGTMYVLDPSSRGGWEILTYERHFSVPADWAEKDNWPEGCTFVHQGLFIACFEEKEQALAAIAPYLE